MFRRGAAGPRFLVTFIVAGREERPIRVFTYANVSLHSLPVFLPDFPPDIDA
ncbi:hypothetical protein BSU04_46190 [Caballeronia sordidicola]|uniref:Uncharacterized protein n=1 Tax=Caballeronia sordidicola TaxID=196367 RepID=A0A226WK71_CABSO|nr:hypothetical protein BSU04_46190 [Caballeronia sordidicola]